MPDFTQFTRRTAEIATHDMPLAAPAAPSAGTTDPWANNYPAPVDRSSLAWRTAVEMLADHHRTSVEVQALAADALLRELGVRGLAQLHSDLHHPAPIDYRFTLCPYCSGAGEDPTQPTCEDLGCPPKYEFAGHDHICPVCEGEDYQLQWFAEEQMAELEELLADAIKEEERASFLCRVGTWLRGSRRELEA